MAKTYDLASVIEREGKKSEPIEIKAGGKTFSIPAPVLWTDETMLLMAQVKTGDMGAMVDTAKSLLGDDYTLWCEAGGNAALLLTIINEATGVTPPES